MIFEFGVSDVLIYGCCLRFRVMVFFVSKFVVISIFGLEVLVYEVIVVMIIVLLGNWYWCLFII